MPFHQYGPVQQREPLWGRYRALLHRLQNHCSILFHISLAKRGGSPTAARITHRLRNNNQATTDRSLATAIDSFLMPGHVFRPRGGE